MQFHGILLTRDDEDIIGPCIDHALTWCDQLYVFDTGSTDETWNLVQDYARRDPRLVAFQSSEGQVLLMSGLRGYVFERYRERMRDGDWVVQVDSDEFFHISPREFVDRRLRRHETGVYNLTYEFRLTRQEADAWAQGRETPADRSRPIAQRRRYYNILAHSEPRMFCYRRTMQWPPSAAYPYNMGYVAAARIPVRHYPCRDPLQVQRRWLLRCILAPLVAPQWSAHWAPPDWRCLLADADDPELHYWAPGGELPEESRSQHLPRPVKRCLQWMAHAALLPLLDRTRPKFPPDYQLPILPPEVVRCIGEAYATLGEGLGVGGSGVRE